MEVIIGRVRDFQRLSENTTLAHKESSVRRRVLQVTDLIDVACSAQIVDVWHMPEEWNQVERPEFQRKKI
ncbi:hypothetical protein B9Z55_023997 [Caenorhabditis nigoni]|nr:hypothetical protein B9Z55_023997 [Caenorhabditis nigoni]